MDIVVTTPTGHVGSELVRTFVQGGIRPRLLLRDGSRLDREIAPLVDVIEGDLADSESVLEATEGADALYWVSPASESPDPVTRHDELGSVVARAITENRIPRTVFQSSLGAERRTGMGEIDGLGAVEARIDETGGSVTHLRCGMFFTNLEMQRAEIEGGTIGVNWPLDLPISWVAPRDIAEVAALRLTSTDWSGRHVMGAYGPRDLTYREVAEIVSAVTGNPLRVEQISDEEMRGLLESAQMSPAQIDAMIDMAVGFRDSYEPEPRRSPQSTTPTSLPEWIQANFVESAAGL